MLASDRPLLVGLLALEQDLVRPRELIEAFRQWRREPATSLGQILAARGNLTPERLSTLERQVADSAGSELDSDSPIDWTPPTTAWRPGSTSIADGDSPTASLAASPSRSTTTFSAAARTDARYKPLRLHAQGGLGRVYLAEDVELHRQVALKEIHPHAADDRGCRHRFVAEAEITGRLEHPGIVPIYGLGADAEGRPFYAMRFIEGENLAAAIKRFHTGGPERFASLEFRQLLSRIVGVCNAIGFAHSKGIIHRDLKPHNVMLGPFGETLVVDWGLAKVLSAAETEPSGVDQPTASPSSASEFATAVGEAVGTPAYMSPEQFHGHSERIGTASDVYGLGAILYVLLTGQSPLHGSTVTDLRQARSVPVVSPRQLQPRVPRPLAAICSKALAYEAHDRYASALEMAADIERWLADEPVTAYREPWLDRAFRWMRKNRLPVAVAAALIVVTAVATTIGYVLVRNERDIARYERGQAVIANQRAQENAAATRQVVDQFLIQVADDRWSEIPGFEDVRLEMVKLAVDKYRSLVAQQPNDTMLGADAALAFRRCGNLYRMMGDFNAATLLHDEAVRNLRQLSAIDPESSRLGLLLCEGLCDLGDIKMRYQGPQAAEEVYREASSTGQRTREKHSSLQRVWQAEARAQGDLADVLRQLGRPEEAVSRARAAHEVLRKAALTDTRVVVNQVSDTYSAVSLVRILRESQRYEEARRLLNQADERLMSYLELQPRDTNLRYLQAWASLERSLLAADGSIDAENANEDLQAAIGGLGVLVREFPKTDSFRQKLAEALLVSARSRFRKGQLESAEADVERALNELRQAEGDEPSAVARPLLATANRLAGEIRLSQGDLSSARANFEAARDHLEFAHQGNPNPQLEVETDEIETLLKRAM
jgi:serine/threonine protein kinase